jgi:hypothetical protein
MKYVMFTIIKLNIFTNVFKTEIIKIFSVCPEGGKIGH